ncbi:MAG: hypothetical protein UV82_C0013G0080 [Candidatus Magasanikbacteria bacterium GW2011_GWD2_43_18]|uniref:DOT1 domain-containing protein n=1 Tax=Candidatus Magasanikbacteria bacterium GW2011_GWE2_42_7 TaxID=1619052 RepID=A0A0G1E6V5_9BACT|nr:MAG: hypothetical protein UV18_C0002G0068 [Candidatus Magasanikbacteria bacterium GW2011_GWC2_42_27]KKS70293.1 MAG: hypothetical protein UV42_C0061G0002 [Candidatus Magasanikbacteria bacterium GW2011_GWE2_42_7]KKT03996.1 MAG: hypothetical protein UV82_C0013G0080 [Candidatus Magasanikbacteria bacterium GW2011_GWD2_43_18]KKT26014.1 MAG: hypothetical protein UW10_C0002G0014 [Candidatus Magasanikbacteria bacterium GW2011_GWA2_43_9]HBB37702.1 hypothetical protein [Candidatus Magasanikbacteria bac
MIYWIVVIPAFGVILFIGIFSFWNLYAIVRGAPFVPSAAKRVAAMISVAQLQKTDVLLDLGSGDGRIVRRVAPLVLEARGIEINPSLVLWSRFMNVLLRKKKIYIHCADFWNYNIADVDVLFVYCIDSKMNRLEAKIQKEMKPGSRVVSNGFIFPAWTPAKEVDGVRLYLL